MKQCNKCGSFQIPCRYRENINWEIKWNSNENIFTLFIYVYIRREDRIKVYYELIPNSIMFSLIGRTEEINRFAENSISRLGNFD
jgi:hypothetical protein